ncbi:MAG: PIN domain-containing protein [Bacteroidales bacterium]|nr:PIN domain-containing protein [Bacteroidales bacterium]
MLYFVDTNIVSYILEKRTEIVSKFSELAKDNEIKIPSIVYYEILRGLLYRDANRRQIAFDRFCNFFGIAELTQTSLQQAACIYAELKKSGNIIEDDDILIGASALDQKATLITNNSKHLGRIPGLKILEWDIE